MAGDEQLHLSDEELRKSLKVQFNLEGSVFPNNKIYGIIDIEPKSAWNLVEKFIFVLNGSVKAEFPPTYRTISVSGFDPRKKHFSAVVRANFVTEKWREYVQSEPRSFHFFGYVFALSPIVKFDGHCDDKEKKHKARLIVQWDHIGNAKAHEYVLYLNEKKIYHIRHECVKDNFEVFVRNLNGGEKYTLQIAAKLINGKETCRSDPIEFTVPTEYIVPTEDKKDDQEILTVLNESIPHNLPVVIDKDQVETMSTTESMKQEDIERKPSIVTKNPPISSQKEFDFFRSGAERLLLTLKEQIEFRDSYYQTSCCGHLPHGTFPGISHYLTDGVTIINKAPWSSLQNEATYPTPALRTTLKNNDNPEKESNAKDKQDDHSHDDDDVVAIVVPNTDTDQ